MSAKEPSHRGQKNKHNRIEGKNSIAEPEENSQSHSPGRPPATPRPERFPSAGDQRGVTFSVIEIEGLPFRPCALKRFLPSGDFYFHSGVQSLVEIDLTSRLEHPALLSRAKILGPLSAPDLPGLSLVYPLPAFDLYDALSAPLFPFAARFRILEKLFSAVSYLHANGVLHLGISLPAVSLSGPAEAPDCLLGGLEEALYVDDPEGRRLPGPLLGAPDHLAPELLESSDGGSEFFALKTTARKTQDESSGSEFFALKTTARKTQDESSGETTLYTAAIDIWALGILSLYVLSGQGIFPCFAGREAERSGRDEAVSALPPDWKKSMLSYIRSYFSAPAKAESLAYFLRAVPRKIKGKVNIPLLSAMLEIDPGKRACARDLGSLLLPTLPAALPTLPAALQISRKIDPEFHNLNKLMIHFSIQAYSRERMEMLFLAVDLLYRASLNFGPGVTDEERLVTAACCLFMAAKLVRETSRPGSRQEEKGLDFLGPSVHRAALAAAEHSGGEVTAHKVLARELSLVEELEGVLYPPRWYHACRTRYQLSCVYEKVIRHPAEEYHKGFRPLEELRREVESEFGEIPEELADLPPDKNITIEEYFS